MAKAKKSTDAYKKLIRLMIVLLALVIIFGTGAVLLTRMEKSELDRLTAENNAVNEKLTQQYNQAVAEFNASQEKGENTAWPAPKQEGWNVVDVSTFPLVSTRPVQVSRSELLSSGMLLLNRWHMLPGDFPEADLVSISSVTREIPVSGSNVKLFPVAVTALQNMLSDAKAAGLENFLIDEGYRDMATQTAHYEKQKVKYEDKYSGDALIEIVRAKGGVNYPGTSEYQSGLSFYVYRWKKDDAEFNKPYFSDTEHSNWLLENSWKYGYIFRFPVAGFPNESVVDKSYKTGEDKNLNIYRYVGVPNAAVMHTMNFCMEEYIEYLIAHPHLAVYENGTLKYEILRLPNADIGSDVTVQVTSGCKDAIVSSDNMGGLIVAMSY